MGKTEKLQDMCLALNEALDEYVQTLPENGKNLTEEEADDLALLHLALTFTTNTCHSAFARLDNILSEINFV